MAWLPTRDEQGHDGVLEEGHGLEDGGVERHGRRARLHHRVKRGGQRGRLHQATGEQWTRQRASQPE